MNKSSLVKRIEALEQLSKPKDHVLSLDEFYELPASVRDQMMTKFYPEQPTVIVSPK